VIKKRTPATTDMIYIVSAYPTGKLKPYHVSLR